MILLNFIEINGFYDRQFDQFKCVTVLIYLIFIQFSHWISVGLIIKKLAHSLNCVNLKKIDDDDIFSELWLDNFAATSKLN